MHANQERGNLRTACLFTFGFLAAAVIVHAALRHLAPTLGWSKLPTFGQSLTLLAAVVAAVRISTWHLRLHPVATAHEGSRQG